MAIDYGFSPVDYERVPFSDLLGETFDSVEIVDKDQIVFRRKDRVCYILEHHQDCCEDVTLEDVCGDLHDLEQCPILKAEECVQFGKKPDIDDGGTWTFYKLATVKGWVDIRFFGCSNGYYSEKVELYHYFPKVK